MSSLHHARISSLAAAVDDLSSLAGELAAALEGGATGEASVSLYEAERSLKMAGRAVERARRSIDSA
jgi:hypothetical protein